MSAWQPVRRRTLLTVERLEDRLTLDTTLPEGFVETLAAYEMGAPTALEFAPDGRLFIAIQDGTVRLVRDGGLLETPFVRLNAAAGGFVGLLGITVAPDFPATPHVYVYYTVPGAPLHNRLSRLTAKGDVADPASEEILLELEALKGPTDHHGGAIHFGPDGHLYVAVGENGIPDHAQRLDNLFGKVLRLRPDGSIPEDNPFVGVKGARGEIWANGFRNPYTFNVQPSTGRIFVNDVGSKGVARQEEINDLVGGGNFGWPRYEGYTPDPDYVSPVFAYGGGFGGGNCSINGGAFYEPAQIQFPADYQGAYFFADYCGRWIKRFHVESGEVLDFAADTPFNPIDLTVGPDGSLYYVTQDYGGSLFRIDYVGAAPNPGGGASYLGMVEILTSQPGGIRSRPAESVRPGAFGMPSVPEGAREPSHVDRAEQSAVGQHCITVPRIGADILNLFVFTLEF